MKVTKEKLSKLTKEEKLQLLDAIAEKNRRKKEARAAFTPHEGQLPIIQHKAKIRVVTSGNSFGKTALGVNEALWAANGYNPVTREHYPVPASVVVVLDSPEKVASVWLPEIKKWYPLKEEEQLFKDGKPFIKRVLFPNGSTITFMFALSEELSFESIQSDFICVDEPVPRYIFIALIRSLRKKSRQGRMLMIMTPISQFWLREYWQEWSRGEHPDTQFFSGNSAQNKANLSDGFLEDFTRHLTTQEYKTRIEGAFFNNEGMALANLWKRDKHIIRETDLPNDYKQAWPHVIAIDPHAHKPIYACLLAAAPNGKKYYVGETNQKILPREFASWLKKNWIANHRVVDIICDSAGNSDFSGGNGFKSFIEVLNECNVRVRGTTYDEKGDDAFLDRIRESLYIPDKGDPLMQFLIGKSEGIVTNIENCQWQKIKNTEDYKPKLDISNQDYLACLKYALAANLTYDNSKRKIIRTKTPSPWAGNGKIGSGYMENRKRQLAALDDDD
jgi:hypothetical protein